MKKRLICLLLVVCIVVALFSGLGATAYAEGENYFTYTVAKNDNLYGICTWYKLTYNNDCKKVIMYLNGWTSETKLNVLSIGAVIKLPNDNAAVAEIVKTIPAATATPSAGTTGTTGSVVVANALIAPDTVSYYLIPYTLKAGDTLYSVCQNLGVDYNKYASQINEINDISAVTRLAAGKSLLIPSSKAPSTGSYYMIVAHKMVSGEYISAVCSSYNLDYNTNADTIRKLNNRDNLNVIKAGQTLLLPVLTTAGSGLSGGNYGGTTATPTPTAGATATPGTTPAATPTATVPPEPTITVAPTIEPAADSTPDANGRYKLGVVTVTGGSISLSVGGSVTNAAKPGDTVLITVSPAEGYKLGKVVAYKTGDTSIATVITTGAFKMPSYDASVSAEFIRIGSITTKTESGGTVKVNKSTAEEGETVTITVTPNANAALESLEVYKSSDSTQKVTLRGKTFVMPGFDVTVSAKFKKAYTITAVKESNGSTMSFSCNGYAVTSCVEGDVVKIIPQPVAGKAATGFTVTYADGSATVTVSDNKFIMPATNVTVKGKYDSSYALTAGTSNYGKISFNVNGSGVATASPDQVVIVRPTANKGYYLSRVKVVGVDSGTVYSDETYTPESSNVGFNMPDEKVKVTPVFSRLPYVNVSLDISPAKSGTARVLDNGNEFDKAAAGTKLKVVATPATNFSLGSITASYNGESIAVAADGTFTVPMTVDVSTCDSIEVAVAFVARNEKDLEVESYIDNVEDTSNKAATVKIKVDDDEKLSGDPVYTGDVVELAYINGKGAAAFNPGYELDRVVVNDVEISGSSFNMPDVDTTVKVYFKSVGYAISSNLMEGRGSVKIKNEANKAAVSAAAGEKITVNVEPEAGYVFKKLNVVHTATGDVESFDGAYPVEFDMKASPVEIEVYFEPEEFELHDDSTAGNLSFKVNGKVVTSAHTDDVVTLVAKEKKGQEVESYKVTYEYGGGVGTKDVEVSGNTFVMPAGDVKAKPVYSKLALPITVDVTGSGVVTVKDNDTKLFISSAEANDNILVIAEPSDGYKIKSVEAFDNDGKPLTITSDVFSMPKTAATVEVVFEKDGFDIKLSGDTEIKAGAYGCEFKLQQSRKNVDEALYGSTVNIVSDIPAGVRVTGYLVSSVETPKTFADIRLTAETKSFAMPAGDCALTAYLEKIPYTIAKANTTNGSFTVENGDNNNSSTYGGVGDAVTVKCTPDAGYQVKSVKVNGVKATLVSDGEYTFDMPAKNASVSVVFEKKDITLDASAVSGAKFKTGLIFRFAAETAQIGETVYVYLDGSKVTEFELFYNGTSYSYKGSAFTMPAVNGDVVLTYAG